VARLLGKYLQLAGACADAQGLDSEFWRMYRLKTVTTGLRATVSRGPVRLFANVPGKIHALVERVRVSGDAPTVIAVRTSHAAIALREALTSAGIDAPIVQGREVAGLARLDGARGVLISIHPAERAITRAGSARPLLLVAELHEGTRQIDNLARAYGASTYESFCSLDEETLRAHLGERVVAAAAQAALGRAELPPEDAQRLLRRALGSAERAFASARRDAHAQERGLDDLLAFSGQRE